jgi:hypothetical protein
MARGEVGCKDGVNWELSLFQQMEIEWEVGRLLWFGWAIALCGQINLSDSSAIFSLVRKGPEHAC